MATLEIQGLGDVEVDDAFLSLSPEQQALTVDEIVASTGELTPEGRQIVDNEDGSFSTERTITVTDPRINSGRPTNIPSMFGGQQVSQDLAIDAITRNNGVDPETGRTLEGFDSIDEAVAAAQQRSESLGSQRPTSIQASLTPGIGDIGGSDILSRISDRFEERGVQFAEILQAQDAGEQTFPETVAQVIGKVGAGSVLDVIGEGITAAAKSAFELLESAAPEVVQGAVEAFEAVADTDVVKAGIDAASQGIEAYTQWAERNPRASRTLDSVANLAVLIAPVKGKPRTGAPSGTAGRAAEGFELRAGAQVARQRTDFLDDLVSPKLTPTLRSERIGRTGEPGLLRAPKVEPTVKEAAIAADVGTVSGVSSKNTVQMNHRIIGQEVDAQSRALKSSLKAEPFPISDAAIRAENKALQKRLKESPALTGDAAKTAKKVGRAAEKFIQNNPKTGAGMLAARKQLDTWIRKQQPKIFDPARENAMSIAVRETRQSMNKLIAEAAPGVGVKQSLAKQSNLLTAMGNIASKATADATSKLGSFRDVLNKAARFKEAAFLAPALVGIGTGALTAPLIATTLVAGGAQLAMTSAAKRAAAKMLRQADKAIKVVKDPATLKQLRVDRVAVLELLKSTQESK